MDRTTTELARAAVLALTVALWRRGMAVDPRESPIIHYLWAVAATWGTSMARPSSPTPWPTRAVW